MTKDEFMDDYAKRSGVSKEEAFKDHVVLPCCCDYEGCHGWAAVYNNPHSIAHHNEFFNRGVTHESR